LFSFLFFLSFFLPFFCYDRLTESTLKNSVSIVEFERGVEGVLALYKTLAANVATEKGRVDIENQVRNDTHVQYEEVRKKKKKMFFKFEKYYCVHYNRL
jgi:hypothetical protein